MFGCAGRYIDVGPGRDGTLGDLTQGVSEEVLGAGGLRAAFFVRDDKFILSLSKGDQAQSEKCHALTLEFL